MHVGLICIGDVDGALDLAHILDALGHDVTIYLGYGGIAQSIRPGDRLPDVLFDRGLVPERCRVRLLRFPRYRDPRSALTVWKLRRDLRDDGVDVAHILFGPGELWLAGFALSCRRIPVVTTLIIPHPEVADNQNIGPGLLDRINRAVVRGSNAILVNGGEQAPYVVEHYGVSPSRVHHVPLAARLTATRWATADVPEEPSTVLFFGRVFRRNGLDLLIKAQPMIRREVPEARILIVGHGEQLHDCLPLIEDPDGFEVHEGFVSGDELAAAFQRAAIVAVPYRAASTSGSLITAYCFGKPVVATAVGCIPEYVEEGATGLLVPPEDEEALARALIRLLGDEGLRRRMSANIVEWVRRGDENIGRKLVAAYEQALRR